MSSELTEEEMRRALFGDAQTHTPPALPNPKESVADALVTPLVNTPVKKKTIKALTPKLKVVLRVGNEFEGDTFEITYEADTLSTLLAEQEATKAARKKFRYVEVVSVKPI